MADLLDIAPSMAVHAVWIKGERFVVRGLSANDAASIMSRFPHIGKLVGGWNDNTLPLLIERMGAAVGPVIAAGCGHLADEKYEHAAAAHLVLDDQATLLAAIWELTFPNGTGSFIEKLTRMIGQTVAGEGAKKIKIRLKQSPSILPPSSGADSRPTMQ